MVEDKKVLLEKVGTLKKVVDSLTKFFSIENFFVLTNVVNESTTFFKVSTFSKNTFLSSTISLTK